MLSFGAALSAYPDIQPIDYFAARDLWQSLVEKGGASESVDGDSQALFFHVLMALSYALRSGHSCIKLAEIAGQWWWQSRDVDAQKNTGYQFADLGKLVSVCDELAIAAEDGACVVYVEQRLYFRRYWQFEQEMAAQIRARLGVRLGERQDEQAAVDPSIVKPILTQLFPQSMATPNNTDWQLVAVANALGRKFTLIVGGPGTGKTTTVTKLLAAICGVYQAQSSSIPALRICLAAPTGKAAQRLTESIMQARLRLAEQVPSEWLDAIPNEASTLHRLLGVVPNSYQFIHHQSNPLILDVLVVDEVSMVDLPMMVRLFRAVPAHAQVILLGDSDQLPSVAAGSVLADLACYRETRFSHNTCERLRHIAGISLTSAEPALDYCTRLMVSHRFSGSGGIGRLARVVIEGEAATSWNLLNEPSDELTLCASEQTVEQWIKPLVKRFYAPLFSAATPEQAFVLLEQFRILAAMRAGEQGVDALNLLVEHELRQLGHLRGESAFYHGRPIMVTQNHYGLGLFNGDIGVIWQHNGRLMAAFPGEHQPRWLLTARLPEVATVYAMTIHKTQGSEFSQIALALPDQDHDLLSRELIYTAITRAKQRCSIRSSRQVWEAAVKRRVQRWSGLREALEISHTPIQ